MELGLLRVGEVFIEFGVSSIDNRTIYALRMARWGRFLQTRGGLYGLYESIFAFLEVHGLGSKVCAGRGQSKSAEEETVETVSLRGVLRGARHRAWHM